MSEVMSALEFADKHNIKVQGINVEYTKKVDNNTKEVVKRCKKLKNVDVENYADYPDKKVSFKHFVDKDKSFFDEVLAKKNFNTYALDTHEIYQIDIDFVAGVQYKQCLLDFVENLKQKTAYYLSSTKHMPHLFFIAEESLKKKITKHIYKMKQEYKISGDSPIELLCGQWGWIRKKQADNKIYNADKLVVLSEQDFNGWFDFDEPVKKEKPDTEKAKPSVSNETSNYDYETLGTDKLKMLIELGQCICLDDLDDYEHWTRIVWSLKNADTSFYNLAKSLSQRSHKYEDKAFEKVWSCNKGGSTLGTYLHYCKRGNPEAYKQIRLQYYKRQKKDFTTHEELACFFIETEGHNIIYSKDDDIFHFNEETGIWEKDNVKTLGRLHKKISRTISEFCLEYIASVHKDIEAEHEKDIKEQDVDFLGSCYDLLKDLGKLQYQIKCVNLSNNVITMVKRQLSIEQPEVEFDMNPNLFSFTNMTFNLITGEVVVPLREDYQSNNCGYNYEQSTLTERNFVEEYIFNTIFTNEEVRAYYKKLLATGLYGKNPQKFIMANGSGGNGKGQLHGLMLEAVGNYGKKGNADMFLNEKVRGGNPELANLHMKRFACFDEPATGKKINTGLMKELTGGEEICARALYSNNDKVVLHMTPVLESNEKPFLGGSKLGDAELRRINDIEFSSRFLDEDRYEQAEKAGKKNIFRIRPEFSDKAFKTKYRRALFDILLEVSVSQEGRLFDNLIPPKSIRLRTEEYVESSKELLNEIRELVEFDDVIVEENRKKNIVSVKQLHIMLKETEWFKNITKKQKAQLTPKYLKEYIQGENTLSVYYSDEKINYKGTTSRSSLCWCRFKCFDEEQNDLDK